VTASRVGSWFGSPRALALGATVLALVVLFPFYWMVAISIQPNAAVVAYPPRIIPATVSLAAFTDVFTVTPLLTWLRNSLVVAVSATMVALVIGLLGGYSLSRFRRRGVTLISHTILVTQMMPPLVLLVPLFMVFREIGLLDRLLGLVLANFAWSLPICVWMLKASFDAVPIELEEAAMVDGCGRLQVLPRVSIPIALPGIAAAAVFVFLQAWDEFIFARTFISDSNLWLMSVGLASFTGEYSAAWQQVMAAATVFTSIPVILFLFVQRAFVSGLAAGAVKG
jgi:multiple sugar transport system permease protein